MKYILSLILLLCLTAAARVVIEGDHVSVYNAQNELQQDSTFTSPSFVQAKNFLINLQKLLADESYQEIFHTEIDYPLRVNHQNKTSTEYYHARELQMNFDQIFTPAIVKTIKDQDPDTLFSTNQGVMIGNGQVWFNDKGLKTINP